MKTIEYFIVTAVTGPGQLRAVAEENVIRHVNTLIEQGWELQGGVALLAHNGGFQCSQAMVRRTS